MRIFPAVDILGGRCVQLVQGKRESATTFGDPLACATRWLDEGADALHVVNLDGAFGSSGKNVELITDLVKKTGVEIELGGGIRSTDDAARWIKTGVTRIIISTLATKEPESIRNLARMNMAATGSWQVSMPKAARSLFTGGRLRQATTLTGQGAFEELGAGSLLYTNVDVEGLQQGVQFTPVKCLIDHVDIPVVVAGGVSARSDIAGLRDAGAFGAVLGSALYSGKITLQDALEESL